jgi:putative phosphoribosyl transferase
VASRARTPAAAEREAAQLAATRAFRSDVPAPNRVARAVDIDAGHGLELPGVLTIPPQPAGVIAFAQGSGSSRLRPPDRAVARALTMAGFATLLFDLLTMPEEAEERNIFDIPLLTDRLTAASEWLQGQAATSGLALGFIGASTGAAAALCAAADLGTAISAIVLRGGRTDLAQSRLAAVTAPTLMITGGDDWEVLGHNRRAQRLLGCPNDLAVVQGAMHFFAEPGALDRVIDLAIAWFNRHLQAVEGPDASASPD